MESSNEQNVNSGNVISTENDKNVDNLDFITGNVRDFNTGEERSCEMEFDSVAENCKVLGKGHNFEMMEVEERSNSNDSLKENQSLSSNFLSDERVSRSRLKPFDSDSSDNEEDQLQNLREQVEDTEYSKDKRIEDSPEKTNTEVDFASRNSEIDDSPVKLKKSRLNPLCDADTDTEDEKETEDIPKNDDDCSEQERRNTSTQPNKSASRLGPLCDPDTSEDEIDQPDVNQEYSTITSFSKSQLEPLCDPDASDDDTDANNHIKKQQKSLKGKSGAAPAKSKKVSAKEQEDKNQEILSESQRMLRERNVSLPYHRPKARSLKEFLEKRPRFTAALPEKIGTTPPSLAIKMTNLDLERITKRLQDREKFVEDFYKSESESESETDNDDKENTKEDISPKMSADDLNIIPINTQSGHINLTEKPEENSDTIESPNNLGEIVRTDNLVNTENNQADVENNLNIVDNYLEDMDTNTETISAKNKVLQESNSFEFSLDNVDFSENIFEATSANSSPIVKELYQNNSNTIEKDLQSSDTILSKKSRRLQLLKEAVGNTTPKLSGDPNNIIDFDEEVPSRVRTSSGVNKLIERFISHAAKKVMPIEETVKVDIMTLTCGELHNEVFTMNVTSDEQPIVVMETPGAKLQKLRTELQSQMALRRSQLWKLKGAAILENVAPEGGGGDCKGDDLLDDDEEEEFELEEEEEEELEDDVELKERKTNRSEFVDDEAELSDPDGDEADEEGDAEEDNDKEEEDNDSNHSKQKEDAEVDGQEEEETDDKTAHDTPTPAKKKLRRIITMDDSDDDCGVVENQETPSKIEPVCKGPLDSTDPWDDDDDYLLLPNAQRPPSSTSRSRTPQLTAPPKSTTSLGFLTPVRQLTALQSLQSGYLDNSDELPLLQSSEEKPGECQKRNDNSSVFTSPVLPLPPDPSPLRGNAWQRHLLFGSGEDGASQSSENMEELANEVCSGKFPSTQSQQNMSNNEDDAHFVTPANMLINSQPSTQDMLDICSGNFTDITQNASQQVDNNFSFVEPKDNSLIPNNMQPHRSGITVLEDITINRLEDTDVIGGNNSPKPIASETLLDDADDRIISQLLDEDEMEKFKKKFESPVFAPDKVGIPPSSPICGRIMFDTSDEEDSKDAPAKKKVLTKKRNKKCILEDSDDDDVEMEDEELLDEVGDELEDETARTNVDYDSEENEVVELDGTESKRGLKASDFFENEAELSESEWDSADEDEKDLDELDIELGDEDKFDQQKLRTGIERVQLRQMLDDDNKDLKILQEMLLEDGELHGTGRERQFKWKNIDTNFDMENGETKENDDEFCDDGVESEEQWRKKRHERVLFLKSQQSDEVDDNIIISTSKVLKLGQKAIVRNAASSQNSQTISEEVKTAEVNLHVKQPYTLLNKRGSFLSRGDKILAKVAEFSKAQNIVLNGPTKFSRNFVFSSVTSETEITNIVKKRKADEGTPAAIKKLRLTNLSPATNKVPGKSAKKLFSNPL